MNLAKHRKEIPVLRRRVGHSRSAEQHGECRSDSDPQNHSGHEARGRLPIQSFNKQAGDEIGILRLAPWHHAQDAGLHRQIQHGDPQHGKKNAAWNIPFGILDLAAKMANVVVAPVAVNRADHRGPQSREPHPRQIEGPRREIKSHLGVEMRGPSPDQPQHGSHDAYPQQNGNFSDRRDPPVQQDYDQDD